MNSWKTLTYKHKLSYILCIAAFVFGILFMITGMFIPPTGVIDGSVLTAAGMLLTFTGSIIGVSQHYTVELEKIKSDVKNFVQRDEEEE